MNHQYCIAIPIYKKFEDLDCVEKISLDRTSLVLTKLGLNGEKKDHPVYFFAPSSLDNVMDYLNMIPGSQVIYFDDKYFQNEQTYSKLLVTKSFYDKFDGYEYMFILQLDCFLFRDEFEEWADKGFDYCGAPIFTNTYFWTNKIKMGKVFPIVGNGGFSMRKVSWFQKVCDDNNPIYQDKKVKKSKDDVIYEDLFFCNNIAENHIYMRRPSIYDALKFAWDFNVEYIMNTLKVDTLPMCAHAIGKNIRAYKNIIHELSDQKVVDYCEEKYKEFFDKFYKDYK